jgi:DNA-binding response OmpR family regulator
MGNFDVIVLDVMLPDGSGMDLCRALRSAGCDTPILLLTARGAVRDRVAGLDAGADDYLGKPFAISELLARVRALGRRGPITRSEVVRVGEMTIDLAGRRVVVEGTAVRLTARELSILGVLGQNLGRVVERSRLVEAVWGTADGTGANSLEVLIARIRHKIRGEAARLKTLRGVGYLLESS